MDVSIYRLRHCDILAVCVLALLCLGIVMVQSASMSVTGQIGWRWSETGTKQLLFTAFAIAAFFIVGHIDYSRLVAPGAGVARQPIIWMLLAAAFACLVV